MDKENLLAIKAWWYRREERLARYDADEEEGEGNSTNKRGGHGNTRLPYGLCNAAGIKVGENWTPKQAWEALEKNAGVSASEAYGELKRSGNAGGLAQKAKEGKAAKEAAPEKKPKARKPKAPPKTYAVAKPDDFPQVFSSGVARKNLELFCSRLDESKMDEKGKRLAGNFGKMLGACGPRKSVSSIKSCDMGKCKMSYSIYGGDVDVYVPDLRKIDNVCAADSYVHEFMHAINLGMESRRDARGWHDSSFTDFHEGLQNAIRDVNIKAGEAVSKRLEYAMITYRLFPSWEEYYSPTYQEMAKGTPMEGFRFEQVYSVEWPGGDEERRAFIKKWDKEYKRLYANYQADKKNSDIAGYNLGGLYDSISGGRYRAGGYVPYGHSQGYFRKDDNNRANESLSIYASMLMFFPDELKLFREDQPEIAAQLDDAIDQLIRKANENG